MGKVIIVSNRLPLKIQKKDNRIIYKSSEGGLATGLGSIYTKNSNLWIGWPGMYIYSETEKEYVKEELLKENMMPVFLSKKEIKDYYEGFSNETLWPTFHYFQQHSVYEKTYWDAYVKVNQKFSTEVARVLEKDDVVWIHDYQLLLLPAMLREKFPDITIGFFLHIPFPSFEIFRLLPWREQILKGMLGADLIGFHTHDYMQHFLNSVARNLGLSNSAGVLEFEERAVLVDAFPMGIDYEKYEQVARSRKTASIEARYRKSIGSQKIILSIDRLDYSKGIPQRLLAFEEFLIEHPEYREKVSLIQVLVPSRDKVPAYKALKEEINRIAGNINSAFGTLSWTPVYYFYRSFPVEVLSAFYRLADIALVTPMRDGMNLVCKEYIASRISRRGVLILSERAGAAIELTDAILINPNDSGSLISAIHAGLNMPLKEQEKRIEFMQGIVKKFNIHHWVEMFMNRLRFVKEKQLSLATKNLDEGLVSRLKKQYRSSSNRLILLDYDGTLVPFREEPSEAVPDAALLKLLKSLCADSSNHIVLISGRSRATLDSWFGKMNIDIVAEHGVWLRYKGHDWKIIETLDSAWKEELRPVLQEYVDRTPGAFIEEKDYSLVWHYRKVEQSLGELRSRELITYLKYLLPSYNLQVLEGSRVVELKSLEVNKGRAALRWIEKYVPDFIMAIGDDWTDEELFRVMPPHAITIKVRSTFSSARFSTRSYKEVRALLKSLAGKSGEAGKYDGGMVRAGISP
jgi:trehalose 6-phosphate synthase/phosphatase